MTTKPSTPFQFNGWNRFDKLGESSYMPHFYEDDMIEPTTPSFRSLSPKIYRNDATHDYFSEITDELIDDGDDLYESTLMNSNFLQSLDTKPIATTTTVVTATSPVNRLRQILNHMNPTHYTPSPLSEALSSPSTRSQFSSSSFSSSQPPVIPMVAFSMPDPRNTKGKGKFNPNM